MMDILPAGMTAYEMIGIAGFLAYMASFALLQAGMIDGNGRAYCLLNIAAAAMVLVSLSEAFNLASALIQISWIAIGGFGLLCRSRVAVRNRRG